MSTKLAVARGQRDMGVKRREFQAELPAPGHHRPGASFGWGIAPRVMN